jgi:hypothetical protein
MAAESPGLRTRQRSDHVRVPDQPTLSQASHDAYPREDGRWRPSGEAVGGAIAGGVAGGYAFGPFGALVGMFVGAAIAVGTTRHFAIRAH